LVAKRETLKYVDRGLNTMNILNVFKTIQPCLKGEHEEALRRIAELEEDVSKHIENGKALSKALDDCVAEKSLLLYEKDQLRRDLEYADWTQRKLSKRIADILSHTVPIPPLDWMQASQTQRYNPWDDPQRPTQVSQLYDKSYFTLPDTDWVLLLSKIHGAVIEASGKYTPEAWDCDDYAWLTYSLTRLATHRAGFTTPPALGWARSRKHAYNVYRTTADAWLVWEPQTGEPVCRLDQPLGTRYETIRIIL